MQFLVLMKADTRDLKVLTAAVNLNSKVGQVTNKQCVWWGMKCVENCITQVCGFLYVWFFEGSFRREVWLHLVRS